IEADRGLLRQLIVARWLRLVVIVGSGGLRKIRRGITAQHRKSWGIDAALRNGLILERLPIVLSVLERRDRVAIIVPALGEVARQFLRRRQPHANDVAAREDRLGPELMRVKEEELVLAVVDFRDDYRAADRVSIGVQVGKRRNVTVFLRVPRSGIPLRVGEDPVSRAVILIRAALGHGRNLKSARPAVFSLIA